MVESSKDLKRVKNGTSFGVDVLELAIEFADIGIWEFDVSTGAILWSDRIYEIAGVSKDVEPTIDTLNELIHPEDREQVHAQIDHAISENIQYDIEYRIVTKGTGKIVWGRHAGRAVHDVDGKVVKMIGASFDITKIKEAEACAEAADFAKSQFLANMSHEIRTPMNGVMGMAELLAASELNSKQKSFADIIIKSGDALLTIINDILDFSKIEAGEMELFPEPFDFADAIEDVAILMSSTAAEKEVELIVRFDPALPRMVSGDAGRIRQVASNLISNAIKFTEHGHILVDVRGETSSNSKTATTKFKVRVEDTGVGIPEEKQRTIFDKFTQVDNSACRTHEGTGLGLSICKSLIELMGGDIGLESELGTGSVFWFDIELPVEQVDVIPISPPVDVTGANILIVDDNSINRSILEEQMQSWRFESKSAANGDEGIAMLRAAPLFGHAFDLVILDYHMPGLNGFDVAKIIRADEKVGATPILLLTSVDESSITHQLKGLNIQGCLMKPAKASHLLEMVIATLQEQENIVENGGARGKQINRGPLSKPDEVHDKGVREVLDSTPELTDGVLDVLIAEDNEVNKTVYRQIMSQTDASFKIASNGREAVDLVAKFSPKVVIMDISMPEMNGYDAAAAIRKFDAELGKHTPIIGATAHAMAGDMEKCIEAGMDDYLPKPISPKRFMDLLDQWLKRADEHAIRAHN